MGLVGRSVVRRIRWLAVMSWLGLAFLALCAPAVRAAKPGSAPAASATTLPATQVTVTSAVLNASVKTLGQRTQWEFQYGSITAHDHSTPVSRIPAGSGTVDVSATITGLTPGTTYRFRVVAISGIGSNYVELYYAATRTFTTNTWNGALRLVRKRLRVSGQTVRAKLTCSSNSACAGRLSIRTRRVGSAGGPLVCATKSFTIGAGATRTVRARISQACLSLLTNAPNHRLKARFSSATTTDQRGQDTRVELILA